MTSGSLSRGKRRESPQVGKLADRPSWNSSRTFATAVLWSRESVESQEKSAKKPDSSKNKISCINNHYTSRRRGGNTPSPVGQVASVMLDSETSWTVACRAPLSMAFSRQEYWSGLPFPPPGNLPNPGIEPMSLALQADSLPSEPPGKPPGKAVSNPTLKLGRNS